MRYAMLALLMASSPALADDACNVFTHETRPPGEVVATLDLEQRTLVIDNEYAKGPITYSLMGAGTGMPYWSGTAEGERSIAVREHDDMLIVDMQFYHRFCTQG